MNGTVLLRRLQPRVRASKRSVIVAGIVVYAGMCFFVLKLALEMSSPVAYMMAIATPFLPFAFALSLRAPLLFPFSLYAAVIPFENLVALGAVGSIPRVLALISTAAIVARIVITKNLRLPRRPILVWGILVLFMAASIMWADNREAAFDWFSRYLQQYLLLLFVAMIPAKWSDVRAVMIGLVIGGVFAALFGDYLLTQGGNYRHDRLVVEAGDRQIDPNEFAAALILPFGLALMYFLRARGVFRKLLAFVPVAVLVGGFVASGSRGGLIAIAVLVAYLLWRSPYRTQLGIFFGVGGSAIFASPLIGRFATAVSSGGAGRTSIWNTGLVAFRKHPLVGVGIGNFQDAYDRAWFQVYHGTYKHWHIVAHNVIVQTGVELGVVGLILLLYAWVVQITDLRTLDAPAPFADVRATIEASTLALFVASLFVGIMHQKATWSVFLLAAIAAAFARSYSPSQSVTASVSRSLSTR